MALSGITSSPPPTKKNEQESCEIDTISFPDVDAENIGISGEIGDESFTAELNRPTVDKQREVRVGRRVRG